MTSKVDPPSVDRSIVIDIGLGSPVASAVHHSCTRPPSVASRNVGGWTVKTGTPVGSADAGGDGTRTDSETTSAILT